MFIVMKQDKPEEAKTWGEMCGDYHINKDGKYYLSKVIKGLYTDITDFSFNAKQFKTKKAAEKALNLRYMFYADENRTLKAEGFEVVEI